MWVPHKKRRLAISEQAVASQTAVEKVLRNGLHSEVHEGKGNKDSQDLFAQLNTSSKILWARNIPQVLNFARTVGIQLSRRIIYFC